MNRENINMTLIDVFDDSWNTDKYLCLLEKLLLVGANSTFYNNTCGNYPFERATSLVQAKLFLKYKTKVDRKRLFDQIMYAIIWEIAVDNKHVYNNNTVVKYHDRNEFILSRVSYKYKNPEDGEPIKYSKSKDNSANFDMAIKFFEENGIMYKRYDSSEKLNKFLSDLYIYPNQCKLDQEFIKIKYTFQKQDDEFDIKPGSINYWCWLDHLPNNLELLINKWKIANPSLLSLCIDKIKEIKKEEVVREYSVAIYEKLFY